MIYWLLDQCCKLNKQVACKDCENAMPSKNISDPIEAMKLAKCRAYPDYSKTKDDLHIFGNRKEHYQWCNIVRWRKGCRRYVARRGK